MAKPISVLSGIGMGAGLMYLLDRDSGRRRRALIRDKAIHSAKSTERAVEAGVRDLRHRTQGWVAEARSALVNEEVSDDILAERVRAQLGHWCSHPSAIEVMARDGCVTLVGPILSREEKRLLRAVAGVKGVREVESRLEPHRTAENIPALQGGAFPSQVREQWMPATRLIAGTIGGVLTVAALRAGGLAGTVGGIAGGLVLARTIANRPLMRLVGVGQGRRLFEFQKTIEIQAPPERVFAYWDGFRHLPEFMSHVKSVEDLGGDVTRWHVEGPAGTSWHWDVAITRRDHGRAMAWKTTDETPNAHAGAIRFEPTTDGGTRVSIHLTYFPPGGIFGYGAAMLLGRDPKHELDQDMLRLKSLLEIGKTSVGGRVVLAEEPVH